MTAQGQLLPTSAGPSLHGQGLRRTFVGLAALFAVITGLAYAMLSVAWPAVPIVVHVRWKPDVPDDRRVGLERQFTLTQGERTEGSTWKYALTDGSTSNIRALIQHEAVDDTAHLNRARYRPEFAQDRTLWMALYAAVTGGAAIVLLLLLAAIRQRLTLVDASSLAQAPATAASTSATLDASAHRAALPVDNRRATVATLVGVALTSIAMNVFAGAFLWSAALALVCIYVSGYVVGALLVGRVDGELGLSLTIIRTLAGLLLTTIGFLLSLVLSLPWFLGPSALVVGALVLRGRTAFAWPRIVCRFQWDSMAAGILALIVLSPNVISFAYMAPGPFPPAFYNVDTAYGMEKVHALVSFDTYPPPSLSNLGVSRTYHYGSYALAAFLSRSSGLRPHHALFLLVLPLLTTGVLAAAFAAARHVSGALPRSIAVPLLLVSIPSLSRPFWYVFGPQLWTAVSSNGLSLERMVGDTSLWGVVSNEGVNIGGDFLILGAIATLAAAPVWGWMLPAFLIGSTLMVKTTSGVALASGLALAEVWRMTTAVRPVPSRLALMAGAVFIALAVTFFMVSLEGSFRLEPAPFYLLRQNTAPSLMLDLGWLLVPALIVLTAGIADPERRSAIFLLMGLAPLFVVNVSRLNNTQVGGGGTGDDWLQMLHAVPFLLHAFGLSMASRRWHRIGRSRRLAFVLVSVVAILPVTTVAWRYSSTFVSDPASGTEFVDNRALASALAVIPTSGTVIVTNDLRYPAGHFARDDRQMQIPALFGHQAFAVNYVYEAVEERRGLQQLLQQRQWSDTILEAARTYRWTHLVIRKDYDHADRIPLTQMFENEQYAVFSFP